MASNPQSSRTFSSTDGVSAPEMVLVYISSQGMVFRTSRFYETGTRLAVGMHLRKIRVDLGICGDGAGRDGNRFLSLRGMVADCKAVEMTSDGSVFQVTVLFDPMGEQELASLEALEQERRLVKRVCYRAKSVMGLN